MTRRRLTCHCGAVEVSVRLATPVSQARRCDCSYCRRRGTAVLSVKLDDLDIVKGEDALALYTFNTGTAKHYFCRICGINTHHQRRSNPDEYGVNALAIDGVGPADIGPAEFYDGVNHPSDA
ncbi:MAG: GFA family protein [Pseudomonadota bacterium]